MAENGIYAEVKKLATRIANDIVKNHPMLVSMANWHSAFTNEIKSVRGLVKALELRVIQLESENETIKRELGMSGEAVPEINEDPFETPEAPRGPSMTAKELRKIRGKYKFSQQNMAELLGVSPHRYNRWERGELDVPPEFVTDLRAFNEMPLGELRLFMHSRGIFQPNGTVARRQSKPTATSIIHRVQQSRYTAEDLKSIRADIGISQKRMADYLGVPPTTYSTWECGQARMPDKYTQMILSLQENPPQFAEPAASISNTPRRTFASQQLPSPYTAHELLALRKRLNLTQKQMAEHFGVHKNTFAAWEVGRHNMPDQYTARANALARQEIPPPQLPEEDSRAPHSESEMEATISIEELKSLRQRLNIDQIRFGQMLGLSPWGYKKWEQGALKNPPKLSAAAKRKIEELSVAKPMEAKGRTEKSQFSAGDLEKLRHRLSMTINAFAAELGVSTTSYSIWKKIDYRIPVRYVDRIERLSRRADAAEADTATPLTDSDVRNAPHMTGNGKSVGENALRPQNEDIPMEALEKKRQELRITQRETARIIGTSLTTYKIWLKKHRSVPKHLVRNAKKILKRETPPPPPASPEKKHVGRPKPSGITAQELKTLRQNLNLTQRKMAVKFGVTTAAYESWELGKARMPETYAAQYRRLLPSLNADSDIPTVDVIPPESPPSQKTDRTQMNVTPEMLLTIKSAQEEFGLPNDKMGRLMDMDEQSFSKLASGGKATIRHDQWGHLTFLLSLPKNRRNAYITTQQSKESKKNE